MITSEETLEHYQREQNDFDNKNAREKSENETMYHLRQIHKLLYILTSDGKKKSWFNRKG